MEQIDRRLQDDFRRCLDYLDSQVEDLLVPDRLPNRPRQMQRFLPKHSDHDDVLDSSLAEYVLQDDQASSGRLSIFSALGLHLDPAAVEQFVDDVDVGDEICTVDNVVTISKVHDQWDPKKVGVVALR